MAFHFLLITQELSTYICFDLNYISWILYSFSVIFLSALSHFAAFTNTHTNKHKFYPNSVNIYTEFSSLYLFLHWKFLQNPFTPFFHSFTFQNMPQFFQFPINWTDPYFYTPSKALQSPHPDLPPYYTYLFISCTYFYILLFLPAAFKKWYNIISFPSY